MKLFGKKKYPNGDRKYYFFGIPYLSKRRTSRHIRTYLFGLRTSKRSLTGGEYTVGMLKFDIMNYLEMKEITKVPVKRNTVLFIEFLKWHAIVGGPIIWYFLELGYDVDIVMNTEGFIHEGFSCMDFPKDRVRVFNANPYVWWNQHFLENMLRYEWIFLNTGFYGDEIYYPAEFCKYYESVFHKSNMRFLFHSKSEELHKFPEELKDTLLDKMMVIFRFPVEGRKIPFVSPTKFGPCALEHKKNEITKFFFAGSFVTYKGQKYRDQASLFDGLCQLVDNGATDFKVVVISRDVPRDFEIPEKLRPFLEFRGALTFPQMYRELNDSDFMISAKNVIQMPEYLYDRASGDFGMSIGFAKPMVIQDEIAATQQLDDTTAVIHQGTSVYDALLRCINMTGKEYDEYVGNLKALRARHQAESLENMRKVFGEAK